MKKINALMVAASAFAVSAAAFADPPALVGRLAYIEGSASIRHAYDGQWAPGAVNFPVVAGDAVWDADNSRSEIELPGGEARIDQLSELDLDQLDDNGTAIRLVQGVLNLTVRYVPRGGIAVTTSIGQLSILQPGEYHFDAGRPNGPPTQVLMGVLQGEALYGQTDLRGGQGVMAPPNSGEASIVSIYATSFDQWAESWAQRLAPSAAQTYVAYDMTGYQDLGNNGVWEENPDLGAVWFPTTVEIGWAPYRYGHWDYVRPWGWTWIDRASWGFAPFHYGRWCQLDGRWGWVPGDRYEHHVYAPALVAFVGGEPGEHMGADIGWVPLGPHEVFHPYYPHSDIYVLNINRAHFHDEHDFRERESHWHDRDYTIDHYANHQAVTNVTTAAFVSREPVHQNITSPQPMGPNRGPAPVMHDFDHLPQPQPHPQPVQTPQSVQPQQPQFRPNPAMGPQPLPRQDSPQPGRPQPERLERPEPLQPHPQPVQEYRPPQPVQQPQPLHEQQPAPAPQPQQFRPNPAMGPQPQQQFRPNPAIGPQPMPQQERPQPMPEYHAPQAVPQQQMPQFHPQPQPQPQPVQQPRPQPQQPSQQQSPQRRDDKDKREQH